MARRALAGLFAQHTVLSERSSLALAQQPWLALSRLFTASPSPNAEPDVAPAPTPLGRFPPERIRNFSIIAHVDHGKSTLADRLLELTGALKKGERAQFLDSLRVERERGITVKAQTVSMVYRHPGDGRDYLLNLIDTPGHVDFSYEVSRALAACEGALLLVDGSQGVQAQTVANYLLAAEQRLDLVPLVTKIDQSTADPSRVVAQMAETFNIEPSEVLLTSAKTGEGLGAVLPAVVERVSPPRGDARPAAAARMLLFGAWHDEYRGVVCLVKVVDGALRRGDRVSIMSNGQQYDVAEVGLLTPGLVPAPDGLLTGQVGYVVTGMRNLKSARVGDTWFTAAPRLAAAAAGGGRSAPAPSSPSTTTSSSSSSSSSDNGGAAAAAAAAATVQPLPGFKPARPMVYAGLYPVNGEDFAGLAVAMERLALLDASVSVRRETSDALGPGFRCGFLGMLHMEVFMTRLEQEFGASVVTTTPTVPYEVELADGGVLRLERASDFPRGDKQKVVEVREPTVSAKIVTPHEYVGAVMELCLGRRGGITEQSVLGQRTLLTFTLPLAELAGDFYPELKALTSGFASFDYEESGYRPADLVLLDILVHNAHVDALSRMVHRSEAARVGRHLCQKLQKLLPRQLFEVSIQAAVGSKVIARETIRAVGKDVTAKCYGGDVTRKRKLLDAQKEGKKKLKRMGRIDVPQDLFPQLMSSK